MGNQEKAIRVHVRAHASKAVITTKDLVQTGLVDAAAEKELAKVEENFSIRLTPHVIGQINTPSIADPIFAQYVPNMLELQHNNDEMLDPIGDNTFEKVKGITHRYPDRLLLKPTHTCRVYCRFCFRREKVGQPEQALNKTELDAALDYIREHKEIWEVILSGGDPLILSNRRLAGLLSRIGNIDHVSVIRFHTRVPLVEPSRITQELADALKSARKTVCFVIHVNHAAELTAEVRAGLSILADNGIPLFSQTVLLKGVNDDSAILADLFRSLLANRVKPYYLHHLDKAQGVSHFRITIERGQELMQELRGRVSGLCLPTYVLDIPGGQGKVPIGPQYLTRTGGDDYVVTDYLGESHDYLELGGY